MIFYFDESFHSRKITKETYTAENYFDCYISTGLGISKKYKQRNLRRYRLFENKYKEIFTVNELKSEIVKKKRYIKGIASFDNLTLDMYYDYFELLNDSDFIYYIASSHKLEYILNQCGFSMPIFLNVNAVKYSLVKLVSVYKPTNIIDDLLYSDRNLFRDLKIFLEKRLEQNLSSMPLKQMENDAITQCMMFLEKINIENITYEWDYRFVYNGLGLLIQELGQSKNKITLLIDKEGNGRTKECAKEVGFSKVRQYDSKKSAGIRCSDLFCGLVGRMMRAINEALKFSNKGKYDHKILLDGQWFDLTEKQFKLYKSIAKYLKRYSNIYYSTYHSIYFDMMGCFIGLVYFFDQYNSYEQFNKIELKSRKELGNDYILNFIIYHSKRTLEN